MKKSILKLLIVLLVITVILIIIIFNKKKDIIEISEHIQPEQYVPEETVVKEQRINKNTFFAIEPLIQNYINAINSKKYDSVMEMLARKYITDNSIDINNIEEFITNTEGAYKVWLLETNKLNDSNKIENYALHAIITDSSKNIEKDIYLEMYIDKNNNTFSLVPTNKKSINEVKSSNDFINIAENNNNKFKNIVLEDKDLLNSYITYYRYNTICNVQKAYELIDEKYRNKKFGDIEEFKKYLDENPMDSIPQLVKYKKENNNNETTYVCIDVDGNYYIFKETDVMKYTIVFDTYTIELPEFLQKYNSTSSQGKVALNIQRFEQALNAKDFKFAYNCLSDGFKSNYFKTQEDFENYIKENWYNSSFNVDYDEFKEDTGLFKYVITIKNKYSDKEKFEKTIIMKLDEETNFEMSFNV